MNENLMLQPTLRDCKSNGCCGDGRSLPLLKESGRMVFQSSKTGNRESDPRFTPNRSQPKESVGKIKDFFTEISVSSRAPKRLQNGGNLRKDRSTDNQIEKKVRNKTSRTTKDKSEEEPIYSFQKETISSAQKIKAKKDVGEKIMGSQDLSKNNKTNTVSEAKHGLRVKVNKEAKDTTINEKNNCKPFINKAVTQIEELTSIVANIEPHVPEKEETTEIMQINKEYSFIELERSEDNIGLGLQCEGHLQNIDDCKHFKEESLAYAVFLETDNITEETEQERIEKQKLELIGSFFEGCLLMNNIQTKLATKGTQKLESLNQKIDNLQELLEILIKENSRVPYVKEKEDEKTGGGGELLINDYKRNQGTCHHILSFWITNFDSNKDKMKRKAIRNRIAFKGRQDFPKFVLPTDRPPLLNSIQLHSSLLFPSTSTQITPSGSFPAHISIFKTIISLCITALIFLFLQAF